MLVLSRSFIAVKNDRITGEHSYGCSLVNVYKLAYFINQA